MVVPEEREGRTGAAMMLSRDPSKAADAVSTRIAGGQEGKNKASRKVNAITDFYLLKHEPQVTHTKQLGILPHSYGWDASPSRVNPNIMSPQVTHTKQLGILLLP